MKYIILGTLLLIAINIRAVTPNKLKNCKTFEEEINYYLENWDNLTNDSNETDFDILIDPKYEDQVKLFIQILLSQEVQKECPLQMDVGEFLEKNKMSFFKEWKTKLLVAYYLYGYSLKHKLKKWCHWRKRKTIN